MFERYTEKARRSIFFARYEASEYGSHEIDTEHLLLGLMRENKNFYRWLPKSSPEQIRRCIDECTVKQPRLSVSVDLPLSTSAKQVLKHAADEADHLSHKHIGTEHLFLGLLDEPTSFAAQLLMQGGAEAESIRSQIAEVIAQQPVSVKETFVDSLRAGPALIHIHGIPRPTLMIRQLVERYRGYSWYWEKRTWTKVDIAIEKSTGKESFDLGLAADAEKFDLVKAGWKKDHCLICHWELFETEDAEHGIGYSNGRSWLCSECYTKFWEGPEFLSSRFSDIT
jgi:Clp amino terminal domain, pathogenicity island component